jgi:hypothetical protein
MPTFDPYYTWLGIRPEEQPPNHYRLLALQAFEDNLDTIQHAADQRMTHLRNLQSSQHSIACQKLLNEVAAAKICLMNPQKKAQYDELLQARLPPTSGGMSAVRPAARGAAQASPAASPEPDAFQQFSADAISMLPRSSGARRRNSVGPAVVVIGLGLAVVVGLIIWGVSQAPTAGGGRQGDVAQGTEEKTRPAPQKTAPPADAPPAKEVPAPPSKPMPAEAVKTPDPPPAKEKPKPDPAPSEEEPSPPSKEPPPDEPPAAAKKLSPPPAAEQDAIVQKLEKLYGLSQLKTAAEKLKVAGQMHELAGKSAQNPAEQFVLLRKATELASESGDAVRVVQAIDAMAAVFEVDALAVKQRALVKIAEKGTGAERLKWLIEQTRIVLDQAQAEKRYDLAMKLAAAVKVACERSREYRRETNDRYLAIQGIYKQWEAMQKAKAALEKNPADAAANLLLGRWCCFQEDDWKQGLPYLAKGSDAGLKAAAALEMVPPAGAEQQLALANAWWDLAAKAEGEQKTPLLRRAGHWYKETEGKLTSTIAAAEAEKRLAQINEYLTPADESPPAKTGEKKELAPREVARLFALQKPKWAIDGDALVGQIGSISDLPNNPFLLKPRRGATLEFSFKIQARWYQCIHVFIDGQRYSYSRGHNRGWATVIVVAGIDQPARYQERVASETDWCTLRATLKDGKLTFYYEGQEEWSGKIADVKGGKHLLSVGFASNMATVKIKDVYLEIE